MEKKMIFSNEIINKKCKNCIFYTGSQCHGHGEFYGTCNLIIKLAEKKLCGYYELFQAIKHDDTWCDFCNITFNNFIEIVTEATYDEKDF